MRRQLCVLALFCGSVAWAADAKPGKIVVSDPAELANYPDYAIQGEYEGTIEKEGKTFKLGVQLVATGDGKFQAKGYYGGLPGAGWDGKEPISGSATREGDRVVIQDKNGDTVGEVAEGTLTLKGYANGSLKRIVRQSPTLGAKPPAGATVLFADEVSSWENGKLVTLSDGKFLGVGTRSLHIFNKPFQLHLEFRTPFMPRSTGQARGNSGVYIQDRYEIQVLDSFGLKGLDNECGGIYKEAAPKVNMCLPPMQWQTYDIDFTPAKFDDTGKKTAPAVITVKHNGVVIHDQLALKSNTPGGKFNKEVPEGGSLYLQNHGDPVVFRNIWFIEK